MENFREIRCVDDLKKVFMFCSDTAQFFIQLKGGGRSWKRISPSFKTDRYGEPKWDIFNEIDGSMQTLTSNNLFNKSLTNIGWAMVNGSFYFAWQ